jgi:hypothetical protein
MSASPTVVSPPTPAVAKTTSIKPVIEPCRDAAQLREYIDTYWRKGHILDRDEAMFRFTYMTPWVDRTVFPSGISVLGIYESGAAGARMLGFLGAIAAPYPRPRSYWLALWHVLPELKGGGTGGKLLQRMQEIALAPDASGHTGWIGTFGAGPEALPVYLKRGYCCRAARRWVFDPAKAIALIDTTAPALNASEALADRAWIEHRFVRHPIYSYTVTGPQGRESVFRTETNPWGVVTHCVRLGEGGSWRDAVREQYAAGAALAARTGKPYLMDAWSFDCPGAASGSGGEGTGWTLAPDDLPSVFHPPEARGNVIYAVGRPFLPTNIHKGDCDQDRPN